ncbi:MAG: hypothetical protein A3G47_02350 [Candidatus Zambryskibacteria bacterium RIFCSPLOWO2_12_FULL_39_45]|nr:MAG: hypothetical protein A2W64_02550 [Candidatus Zambryskibacteria bacterium RIFCSPLOWO2_02_39_10]OHB10404.1 MAG: hypothetical protein A3I21_01630 [Candidatus Zambryskibacteria bacterium RIFCSPLOWO2_02_FULL_39_69]OHB13892.1 MAG: hypothetical protein A3G47_02350 [Candidatus Zambryskibacteria bacterium RIFCSPLOWO2_12_FULL_39_45]
MKKQKILYAITIEDVLNVSKKEKMSFDIKNLPLVEEKIGDYMGDKWHEAIEYALIETNKK